jgi:hypothetical protein
MEGIIVWPFTLPQNKKRKNEPISQQFTNPLTQLKPLLMIKLRSGGCWDPVFDGSTHMFTGSIVHVLMVKSSFFLYIDSQMYDDIVKSEQQWLGQLLFWVIWLSHIPLISPWNPVKSTLFHGQRASLRCSHGCRWHGTSSVGYPVPQKGGYG